MKKFLRWSAVVAVSFAIITVVIVISFGKISAWCVTPDNDFDEAMVPVPPIYSDVEQGWAAHPLKIDESNLTLSKERKRSGSTKVDVFFVHPTAHYGGDNWNSDMHPDKGAAQIISHMIAGQTTMFNHCCRIYAPHYREANIRAFVKEETENSVDALSLAYQDVLNAFDYYMANENQGRPFIFASHSQGTYHLMRLLEDRVDGKPLQAQMIVAYAIGYEFPLDKFERTYKTLLPCDAAHDLNCVISWAAYGEGTDFSLPFDVPHWYDGKHERSTGKETLCHNPLNWSMSNERVPAALHKGALPMPINDFLTIAWFNEHTGHTPQSLSPLWQEYSFAQCKDGRLLIAHYPDSPFAGGVKDDIQNYHGSDINLFFGNLRENATHRIERYFDSPPAQ